jgi:hypothetical protein
LGNTNTEKIEVEEVTPATEPKNANYVRARGELCPPFSTREKENHNKKSSAHATHEWTNQGRNEAGQCSACAGEEQEIKEERERPGGDGSRCGQKKLKQLMLLDKSRTVLSGRNTNPKQSWLQWGPRHETEMGDWCGKKTRELAARRTAHEVHRISQDEEKSHVNRDRNKTAVVFSVRTEEHINETKNQLDLDITQGKNGGTQAKCK